MNRITHGAGPGRPSAPMLDVDLQWQAGNRVAAISLSRSKPPDAIAASSASNGRP
ncbi:hypothetical protein FHT00_001907 [Sphingomonas insulae]|uniref:hypothetical protein n=1 Tax=Sphingomonas insulae TaxID=424800 RepID=UPI0013D1E73B|nr:hypothetical protein [Sphingomonas insulae]NIJ29960.1 hypothetical protein [Sphingomonas insulae]